MYRLTKKIEKVKEYCISHFNNDDNLLYLSNGTIWFNENIIVNDNISAIDNLEETLIYSVNYEILFYFNLKNNENKEIYDAEGFSQFVNKDLILVRKNSEDYTKQYVTLFNLKTKKKKWTIESYFGNGEVYNNYLYTSCINNKICKIDLDHPEQPIWHFDLNQLGTFTYDFETHHYKVEKILGVHNGYLYVALNGSLLLEFDIKSGKITHQWHHLPEKYKNYQNDDFAARLFDVDKENNQLVCLADKRYDTIDLGTKKYNSTSIIDELKKFDIVSIRHQGDFTNNHITAIAHLKNDTWFQDGIVVFNRITHKIDWFYKDDTFTTGTDTPKLSGNKLYQLDNNNTLHIFEKTENESV